MGNFLTWLFGGDARVGHEVRSVKRKREDSEAQEEASVKRQIVRSSSRTPSDVSGVRDVKKGNVKLNDDLEWIDGKIPYVLDSSLNNELWMVLELAMETIEKHSRMRFVERSNNEDTYVEIYKGDGCFFQRGDGFQQPHRVSLGIGCEDFGTVLHELMHAIGFPHEHNRPDRDEYVTIHWENIEPDSINWEIRDGMDEIEAHSRVVFTEMNFSGPDILYITSGDGCFFSPYECFRQQTCQPILSLGAGCWNQGTILHELLHSIGFPHEHQRPDRNKYIKVIFGNIDKDNKDQYRILPASEFVWDFNSFPFDYSSIMMYGPTYFAKYDGYPTMERRDLRRWRSNRSKLSKIDKQKLGSL